MLAVQQASTSSRTGNIPSGHVDVVSTYGSEKCLGQQRDMRADFILREDENLLNPTASIRT